MARQRRDTKLPPPFLKRVWLPDRDDQEWSQIIMATHSPILMVLPDADLWHIDRFGLRPVALEDTAHFRLYRNSCSLPMKRSKR